jgi:hypothetical protein
MMIETMRRLRRSPRTLLERDGHPGPGPGRLAVVMARAGIGKTACLVGVGLDALLSGQNVLHISLHCTVEKVRTWYDDILREMLRREPASENVAEIQLEVERRRHIHTYVGRAFSLEKLRQALELLRETMAFVPRVIIFDQPDMENIEPATVAELKRIATAYDAELWMACRTHRDGPPAAPGHLAAPADRFENHVDLAFSLEQRANKVRLHVLKDREAMLDKDLNILLDTETLLLVTGVAPRAR